MKTINSLILCLICCAFVGNLAGQTLDLSDSVAPPLEIDRWLNGEPTNDFEKGTWHVLTFSSQGCPPCVAAIPVFNELSGIYRDELEVTAVYVGNVQEGSDGTRTGEMSEPRYASLIAYVEQLIETYQITYRVGIDSPTGDNQIQWHIRGVPRTYLINDNGQIVWAGSGPDDLIDILPGMLDGMVDASILKRNAEEELGLWKRIGLAYEAGDTLSTVEGITEYLTRYPEQRKKRALGIYRMLVESDVPFAQAHLYWMLQNIDAFSWSKLANLMMDDICRKKKLIDLELVRAVLDKDMVMARGDVQVLSSLRSRTIVLGNIAFCTELTEIHKAAVNTFHIAINFAKTVDNDQLEYFQRELEAYLLRAKKEL